MASTANKLNEVQRLQVKSLILKLDGRGWSQFQIRDELKRQLGVEISQPMVSIYRKQVWQETTTDFHANKEHAVPIKVEQLRDIRREAWSAWERSSEDASKVVLEFANQTEQVGIDDYVTSEVMLKRIETKEGRLPDNAYLTTILKTLEQERQLLGLDP